MSYRVTGCKTRVYIRDPQKICHLKNKKGKDDILSRQFSDGKFSHWSGLFGVADSVHDNAGDNASAATIFNVGVFVIDIKEDHEFACDDGLFFFSVLSLGLFRVYSE